MKKKIILILLTGLACSMTIHCEDSVQKEVISTEKKEEEKPKSPHTFTATVAFVSDYRFRGISQTMREPAVQGNFDYSHTSGIYLGTFGSNVDGTTHFYNNTSMEWDFYGGFKNKLFPSRFPDLEYNVGVIYYYYPGGQAHVRSRERYNTFEYTLQLTYKWFTIKFFQTLTNYFGVTSSNPPENHETEREDCPNGSSRGSIYVEASALFQLREKMCYRWIEGKKLSLLLLVGHQTVRHYEHLSYTDWSASLIQEFEWVNVTLTYIGTNANHDYYDVPDNAYHPKKKALGAQGVVIGVSKTF